MQDYTHVKYDERNLFKDLLLSDICKKMEQLIYLKYQDKQVVQLIPLKDKLSDLKR